MQIGRSSLRAPVRNANAPGGLSRRPHRTLGFIATAAGAAGGPPGIAIGAAIDIGAALIAGLNHLIGQGRAQADQLGQTQNGLTEQLNVISDAAQAAPDASVEELQSWADQVKKLGDDYYQTTLGFDRAGPGARATMLGFLDETGTWQTDAQHPGYLTALWRYIVDRILKKKEEEPVVAGIFDNVNWGNVIEAAVTSGIKVIDTATQQGYKTTVAASGAPNLIKTDYTPWLIGFGVLGLLLLSNNRERRA
jgi:hypothetical protein